jgi:hypothetical protein
MSDIEQRAQEIGHEIAMGAIAHLDVMYPAALAAVPSSATVSLRNCITAEAAMYIKSALQAERDGALEEAAEICDNRQEHGDVFAKQIRALKGQP